MPPVRAADRGNAWRVPRSGKPVVDGRADAPARDRRLARPMMAGNEQNDTVAGVNRLLENAIDGRATRCRASSGAGRAPGRARPRPSGAAGPSLRRGCSRAAVKLKLQPELEV